MHSFFFEGDKRFSPEWFKNNLEVSIENAGERYTPKANVQLPLSHIFDGLGLSSSFYKRLCLLEDELNKSVRQLQRHNAVDLGDIHKLAQSLSSDVRIVSPSTPAAKVDSAITPTLISKIQSAAESLFEMVVKCNQQCDSRIRELKKPSDENSSPPQNSAIANLQSVCTSLHDLASAAANVETFFSSPESLLAATPALLVTGDAGQGKTHLLCDEAVRSTSMGRPRLLLHGVHFVDGEPWQQIVRQLGLNCSVDEFLGSLNSSAQAYDCRIVILVDALNEGPGNVLWKKHLAGFLSRLRKYKWLAVCVSVRSTYVEYVIPNDLAHDRLIRQEHRGFSGQEYVAVNTYFSQYNIAPSYPILSPKFSNPLLLKLFCEAMYNRGLTSVPAHLFGITSILDFFLDSVNEKLSDPTRLDYPMADKLVHRAVHDLCQLMVQRGTEWLTRQEAAACVSTHQSTPKFSNSLFFHLIQEGVLSVDAIYDAGGQQEIVRIGYQRFSDYLKASAIIDMLPARVEPIRGRSKLGQLFRDVVNDWRSGGLLEALSVQLAERVRYEFAELLPFLKNSRSVRKAFAQSIAWRDPASIDSTTLKMVEIGLLCPEGGGPELLDSIVAVASVPQHPLNATYLNKHLAAQSLAMRDSTWTIFLNREWGREGAVARLSAWLLDDGDKAGFSDSVITLSAIAATWCLTTTNRRARDLITKGLVRTLEDRATCIVNLLTTFEHVDDMYISERLYAVAYGFAMRTSDMEALRVVAKSVYDFAFQSGTPPRHIRLRDYARGVIEKAVSENLSIDLDINLVRPPYRSQWPSQAPANRTATTRRLTMKGRNEQNLAVHKLTQSVCSEMEDFCKHVIGDLNDWTNVPLHKPAPGQLSELAEQFESGLTATQFARVEEFRGLLECVNNQELQRSVFKSELSPAEMQAYLSNSERKVRNALRRGSAKEKAFDNTFLPFVRNADCFSGNVDVEFARSWILEKVATLGWNARLLGSFDLSVNRHHYGDRFGSRVERIGKKYQWIAYWEFITLLSDNFWPSQHVAEEGAASYQGPWQLSRGRDIDPSMLLYSRNEESNDGVEKVCWWASWQSGIANLDVDDHSWLQSTKDLPRPESMIEVFRESDSSRWINLEGYYKWEPRDLRVAQSSDTARRRFNFWVSSYLVHENDGQKLASFCRHRRLTAGLVNRSPANHVLFLGELFWPPAYFAMDNLYHGKRGWTRGSWNELPVDVLETSEEYMRESGSGDASLESTVNMYVPCKEIVRAMGLRWGAVQSEFVDGRSGVVAYDPSGDQSGPSYLLVRRDEFLSFLKDERLTVVWTIGGEKMMIGGAATHENYIGHLEIDAVCRLKEANIEACV